MLRIAILIPFVLFTSPLWAQCSPPDYSCARTDGSIIQLPSPLPNFGGYLGAGTTFTEPTFNNSNPPLYVRVTDSSTNDDCNPARAPGFEVTDSSGDESVFNQNDTIFYIHDSGNNPCFFSLNPNTMQTSFLYAGAGQLSVYGAWSQIYPKRYYEMFNQIWRVGFDSCSPGGGSCNPSFSEIYDFVANCGVAPYPVWTGSGGIGGTPSTPDNVYAVAFGAGTQNTAKQVVAYVARSNTCYFYQTKYGTVRSYVGTQTPTTGTLNCDGSTTVTWASGARFDYQSGGGIGWTGLTITIAGSTYTVDSVTDSMHLVLTAACPSTSNLGYSILPGHLLGAVSTPDRFTVHNVKIDPSGSWLVIVYNGTCFAGNCWGPYAWQIGTTTVKECQISCGTHWTESANGWFNNDNIVGWPVNMSMLFRAWADFDTTSAFNLVELSGLGRGQLTTGTHPSNKNDAFGASYYPVLTSTYVGEIPGQITQPYSNEIVGWLNPGPGPIMRFGHTFNSGLASEGFSSQYTIGAPSSTGQFYIFSTDCLGQCPDGSDVFILNLAPPASGRHIQSASSSQVEK
jgi:hypothetical protein